MDSGSSYDIVKSVEGWLTDNEVALLYGLAKSCKGNRGVIVEIGSWKGKSTICLGVGAKEGSSVHIYAIDPYTGSSEHQKESTQVWTYDEFLANIGKAGVSDVITPMAMTSREAAEVFAKPIELIFIDGAHEYDSVRQDFDLWSPKVVDGGVMAFHDTFDWAGPRRVVRDSLYKSRCFKNLKFVDTTTYGTKVHRNTLSDVFRNRCALFLRDYNRFLTMSSKPFVSHVPKPIKAFVKKYFLYRPSSETTNFKS